MRPKRPSIIVHAKGSWYSSITHGKFDFFEKLAAHARFRRYDCYVIDADLKESKEILHDRHCHIMVGQTARSDQPAFYAMPSYIWGFWYLDPEGVHWNSSVREMTFNPNQVDAGDAGYFFYGVCGYMLRQNVSKFNQPSRQGTALPPAKATIFLQEIDKYKTPVHYLDTRQMVTAAARSTSETLYVKLHPAQSYRYQQQYLDLCGEFENVVVSDRSIHDLTEASDMVITQNSAAGFEALMQEKPVITCARTDYHHATVVARTEDELADAVQTAPQRQASFPYKQYFYWFLGQQMLEPQKDEFETRAWERIGGLFE